MRINLLNNSLSAQQPMLKSIASQRGELVKSSSETITTSSIDTAAQQILSQTDTVKVTPVYLTNAMAQGENALLNEVISLKNERDQKIAEIVSCGIEPTKAKYLVSSKQGVKGLAVLKEYKSQKADEVIANSTKDTENQQAETSEEMVEEQVEVTKTDPTSGEQVKEVRVVKKVRTTATRPSSSEIDMKVLSSNAVKGQHVNITV